MLNLRESNLYCMNTYGERLEHALALAKKDRAALGKELGISIQAIGQVIAGKTKALTAENSVRAARFLDVDQVWLATGEGHPQTHKETSPRWPFVGISPDKWHSYDATLHAAWEAWIIRQMEAYDAPPPSEHTKSSKSA